MSQHAATRPGHQPVASDEYEIESARVWARNQDFITRGQASDVIAHYPAGLKPDHRVCVFCRVSSCAQNHDGNLSHQACSLRRLVRENGGAVVAVCRHVGSGRLVRENGGIDRAVARAGQYGANVLLADSTDRFVRHYDYHSVTNPPRPGDTPSVAGVAMAREWAAADDGPAPQRDARRGPAMAEREGPAG
jgi:hypothetical protein